VIGIFLKEFLVRFGNLLLLIMYFFHWIDFDSYVILYVVNLSFPAIVLFIYLLVKDEFGIRFTPGFFTPTMRKDIVLLAFFGVIGGFSGIAVINIDKYMINHYLDLSATGIYSITFYFSTLILMPNRSLSKISITLLAENWKQNDLNSIRTIYYKSSINQLLIAMLLFLGIWCNTHNIFDFLPDEYRAGKYVIFFIGLGNMVNMLSGVSMQIISTSKYYRYQTYLMLLLIVLVVISNILFIPAYGLIGAALASMISTIIFVVFRFAFVYKTFNMHPFRKEHLYAIIIFVVTFGINYLIPKMENLYVDLIIRSAVISIVFLFLSWKFKVSEDGMELLDLLKQRVRKLFNSDA
jgi:O-antigen/teichoic acid export membrane protein